MFEKQFEEQFELQWVDKKRLMFKNRIKSDKLKLDKHI